MNKDLFDVVTDYTYALDTLDSYDYQRLTINDTTSEAPFRATYDNAMQAIHSLKERFGESPLFGNEKDESFKSSIGQIYQTFDGVELSPAPRRRPPCCSISSPRTIRSATATNASPLRCSCGF